MAIVANSLGDYPIQPCALQGLNVKRSKRYTAVPSLSQRTNCVPHLAFTATGPFSQDEESRHDKYTVRNYGTLTSHDSCLHKIFSLLLITVDIGTVSMALALTVRIPADLY